MLKILLNNWGRRSATNTSTPLKVAASDQPLRPDERFRRTVYCALGIGLFFAIVAGICIGQYPITPVKVFSIAAQWGGDSTALGTEERIVLLVRGPRILLVAICGAGLALAGSAMQGVFRNPLAAPELLGVSAGSAFGGALIIVLGFSGVVLIGSAFLSGLGALLLVGTVARLGAQRDATKIILGGIVIGTFFSALVSTVQLFADPHNSLPAIVFWMMGSFAATSWSKVLIAVPAVAVGGALLWAMRFRLNILSLGDEEASSLGISVERDRWLVFLATALIVGATVSVAGIIGWVSILIPHAARLLVGHDHRAVLPASGLLGSLYLCVIDILARNITPTEVPIGILTAVIGAPFIITLLRMNTRQQEKQA